MNISAKHFEVILTFIMIILTNRCTGMKGSGGDSIRSIAARETAISGSIRHKTSKSQATSSDSMRPASAGDNEHSDFSFHHNPAGQQRQEYPSKVSIRPVEQSKSSSPSTSQSTYQENERSGIQTSIRPVTSSIRNIGSASSTALSDLIRLGTTSTSIRQSRLSGIENKSTRKNPRGSLRSKWFCASCTNPQLESRTAAEKQQRNQNMSISKRINSYTWNMCQACTSNEAIDFDNPIRPISADSSIRTASTRASSHSHSSSPNRPIHPTLQSQQIERGEATTSNSIRHVPTEPIEHSDATSIRHNRAHQKEVGQQTESIRSSSFGSVSPSRSIQHEYGQNKRNDISSSIRLGSSPNHIISGISSSAKINSIKILVIAPNIFGSHYALFNSIVRILLAQKWIHKIKLFVPELTSLHRKPTDLSSGGKLVVEYFNPHEMAGGKPRIPQMISRWSPRDYRKAKNAHSGSRTDLFLELAKQRKILKALKSENFDIGIAELWDHGAFPIFWLLGIKNIFATQNMPLLESIHYEYLGYLDDIIEKGDIPELSTANFDDHKVDYSPYFAENFRYRIDILDNLYENELMGPFGEIAKNYYDAKQVPDFRDLFNGIRQIFINTQPFLNFPMPPGYPSKIVHIGGIQLAVPSAEQATMDDIEIQAIEASRERKGLIMISFGTIVSMTDVPDTTFAYFLKAFTMHSDYEFLWRFDSEEDLHLKMLKEYENIHVNKWLNQFAILGNVQTKLFISHCGINSIIESIHHAVPILCMPFMADQFYNAEALAKQNAAFIVNKDDLTDFGAKISEALEDRYKQNIIELKMKMDGTQPAEKFLEKIREIL